MANKPYREIGKFYKKIEELHTPIKRNETIIFMADFNAKFGKHTSR